MTTSHTTKTVDKGPFPLTATAILASAVFLMTGTLYGRWMIVGNDEKTTWDDQGKQLFFPGRAKDSVCLVDLAGDPLAPKIVATLPLENSVYGPPTNLAITHNEKLAFVANPVKLIEKDGQPTVVPDNKLHVIDLEGTPRHLATIEVGQQPSGMDVSPDGKLAAAVLIRGSQNARANPATAWAAHENGSVAVLAINGRQVRKIGEIELGGMPEGVVFSPDSRYIYVGNFLSRDVSILKASGRKVVDTGQTLKLPGQPGAMRGSRR